jgi:plastocyanin
VPGGELIVMNRRRFIAGLGAAAAGGSLLGLADACGGASGTGPTTVSATGSVRGTVVDMSGHAQQIGRIYLLAKSGLNSGAFADVGAAGAFDFGPVPVGQYQLRYWGANLAGVPEPMPNPVRIAVAAGTPTTVQFKVEVGGEDDPDHDIYIGDYFFQDQPVGAPNGVVTAKLGTVICWYNVGTMLHSVVGGPWGDSGPIALDGNFSWTSDRVGTFQYRCGFHGTQMIATLQITA